MSLEYKNKRTKHNQDIKLETNIREKSQIELFDDFFEMQNNVRINDGQRDLLEQLIDEIWE